MLVCNVLIYAINLAGGISLGKALSHLESKERSNNAINKIRAWKNKLEIPHEFAINED